jgi:hypothetical protein
MPMVTILKLYSFEETSRNEFEKVDPVGRKFDQ